MPGPSRAWKSILPVDAQGGGYEEEQDSLNHGYSFPPATLVQLPPRGSYFSVTAGSACTGMDALHAGAAHRQEDEQFQN